MFSASWSSTYMLLFKFSYDQHYVLHKRPLKPKNISKVNMVIYIIWRSQIRNKIESVWKLFIKLTNNKCSFCRSFNQQDFQTKSNLKAENIQIMDCLLSSKEIIQEGHTEFKNITILCLHSLRRSRSFPKELYVFHTLFCS